MRGGEASGTEEKREEGREREFESKKEDLGRWVDIMEGKSLRCRARY